MIRGEQPLPSMPEATKPVPQATSQYRSVLVSVQRNAMDSAWTARLITVSATSGELRCTLLGDLATPSGQLGQVEALSQAADYLVEQASRHGVLH